MNGNDSVSNRKMFYGKDVGESADPQHIEEATKY